jgi:hypothetical protein
MLPGTGRQVYSRAHFAENVPEDQRQDRKASKRRPMEGCMPPPPLIDLSSAPPAKASRRLLHAYEQYRIEFNQNYAAFTLYRLSTHYRLTRDPLAGGRTDGAGLPKVFLIPVSPR